MSEPKELWEVARDASDLAMQCGKPYWSNIVGTVIAEHERRKADPYAHLKAAAADPTKQVKVKTWIDWVNGGMSYQWSWHLPPEDYEIRDKPKKVDWSQLSEHVHKYWASFGVNSEFPSVWIPWGLPEFGDKCPVPEGVMVSCVLRRYQYDVPKLAEFFNWDTINKGSDIIAFRITGIAEGWEP